MTTSTLKRGVELTPKTSHTLDSTQHNLSWYTECYGNDHRHFTYLQNPMSEIHVSVCPSIQIHIKVVDVLETLCEHHAITNFILILSKSVASTVQTLWQCKCVRFEQH